MRLFDIRLRFLSAAYTVYEIIKVCIYYASEFQGGRLGDNRLAFAHIAVPLENLPSSAMSAKAHKSLGSAYFHLRCAERPVGELGLVFQVDNPVHIRRPERRFEKHGKFTELERSKLRVRLLSAVIEVVRCYPLETEEEGNFAAACIIKDKLEAEKLDKDFP